MHTHATENNVTSSALAHFERDDFTLYDHPTQRGIDWKSLPTLPYLLSGRIKGRENDQQVTGFVNNIGMGAQFAAFGKRVYEAARARGSWMVAKGAAGPEVCKRAHGLRSRHVLGRWSEARFI